MKKILSYIILLHIIFAAAVFSMDFKEYKQKLNEFKKSVLQYKAETLTADETETALLSMELSVYACKKGNDNEKIIRYTLKELKQFNKLPGVDKTDFGSEDKLLFDRTALALDGRKMYTWMNIKLADIKLQQGDFDKAAKYYEEGFKTLDFPLSEDKTAYIHILVAALQACGLDTGKMLKKYPMILKYFNEMKIEGNRIIYTTNTVELRSFDPVKYHVEREQRKDLTRIQIISDITKKGYKKCNILLKSANAKISGFVNSNDALSFNLETGLGKIYCEYTGNEIKINNGKIKNIIFAENVEDFDYSRDINLELLYY